MALPPSDPNTHDNHTCPSPGLAEKSSCLPGTVAGLAITTSEACPRTASAPLPVSARIAKVYCVPLVRSVTVWLNVAVPTGLMALQGSESCCISQPLMPGSAGLLQLSVTWLSPTVAVGVGACAGTIVRANVSVSVSPSSSATS